MGAQYLFSCATRATAFLQQVQFCIGLVDVRYAWRPGGPPETLQLGQAAGQLRVSGQELTGRHVEPFRVTL